MNHPRSIWIAGIGVACVGMLILQTMNRDERIIRQKIDDLIARCEKKPGRGVFQTLASAADLRAFFMPEAILKLGKPYPAQLAARELPPLIARAQLELESLHITLNGVEFLPRTAPGQAETRLAIELKARRGETAERFLDEYRVRWQKIDGDWKIADARSDSSIQPTW